MKIKISNKMFLSIILILIVTILLKSVMFNLKYTSDEYKKEYMLFVVSKYQEKDNMVAYNVTLNNDKFIMKIYDNSNENINLEELKDLKYGDYISVLGKIVVPDYMNNPGEFNYKYYLYSNNIHGEFSVSKINSIGKAKLSFKEKILSSIYSYKEYMGSVFEKYMNSEKAELAKSIIYGETVGLEEDVKESFEQTGLSHIMAISGSNITSLVAVITLVFSFVKLKGKLTKIVISIVILIFVILTGSSLATLRAGIMGISSILFHKKLNPLKSYTLAIFIILLYAPYSIFNTGCLLSFLATFGIVILVKPLSEITERVVDKIKIKFFRKIANIIFLNLWIAVAVQIMILPVQINSFNVISPTQIVFNIVLSGVQNIITALGAVFVLFSYVPIFNFLLVKGINICISIILFLIRLFQNISLNINVADWSMIVIIMYYCIIFSFLLKIYLKNFSKYLGGKLNRIKEKRYLNFQVILIILTLVILILSNIYYIYLDSFVYFFNVGQGEMAYIKSGVNSVIVDIGSLKTNLAYNTISNYFKMKNISEVDCIILSHMHSDHVNGLEQYLENYKTKLIIYSKGGEDTEVYEKFKKIVERHNVEVKESIAGDKFVFGNIEVEILLPDNKLINVEDNINANSLVCKVNVGDKSILFMGDGIEETEKKFLTIYDLSDIYLLKVGHHGSKTSTSDMFIKKISPKYAIISAKKSYYNHPHEQVLEVLKKYNVNVYVTEKMGAIKFNMYNFWEMIHNIFSK